MAQFFLQRMYDKCVGNSINIKIRIADTKRWGLFFVKAQFALVNVIPGKVTRIYVTENPKNLPAPGWRSGVVEG